MTITRLLAALDKPVAGRPAGLARGTVLIVDEAGMLGTRPLARLLAHARAADAKLVLFGDHHQLPELTAGGAFRALAATMQATELQHNRRQAEPWERGALDQLRNGDASQALDDHDAAGRVQRAHTGADARCALTAAWWTAATSDDTRPPSEQVVMLAVRRTDVDELNLRARAQMTSAGRLTDPTLTVPVSAYAERSFAAGDLVIARRNDYIHGLINGQRGTVRAVDPDAGTLTVELGGTTTTVPAAYLASGGLDHGYALTVHQSQGMTCEQAMLLGSDALYREAGYVGMSRPPAQRPAPGRAACRRRPRAGGLPRSTASPAGGRGRARCRMHGAHPQPSSNPRPRHRSLLRRAHEVRRVPSSASGGVHDDGTHSRCRRDRPRQRRVLAA